EWIIEQMKQLAIRFCTAYVKLSRDRDHRKIEQVKALVQEHLTRARHNNRPRAIDLFECLTMTPSFDVTSPLFDTHAQFVLVRVRLLYMSGEDTTLARLTLEKMEGEVDRLSQVKIEDVWEMVPK